MHFNHATGARADVLEERWGRIGHEVVEVDGVAGMFFRPEPWKHEALGLVVFPRGSGRSGLGSALLID